MRVLRACNSCMSLRRIECDYEKRFHLALRENAWKLWSINERIFKVNCLVKKIIKAQLVLSNFQNTTSRIIEFILNYSRVSQSTQTICLKYCNKRNGRKYDHLQNFYSDRTADKIRKGSSHNPASKNVRPMPWKPERKPPKSIVCLTMRWRWCQLRLERGGPSHLLSQAKKKTWNTFTKRGYELCAPESASS